MPLFAFLLLCLSGLTSAEPLLGVILEEATDRPIPYAELQYSSGKVLGQADRRGRFELQVDRRNASLVVVRNGYDTAKVELQDYSDLLDVVITLRSSVRELGQTTVRAKVSPKWQGEREVSVARLEDAAGLRFDLAEHLAQLPGMSGQKDFSSALSYDGSRSEEVAYHLGNVRVPNMRHLDVGFPGNLSVINPHVLRGVEVHDHYGSGPIQQGLASAIQFKQQPGTSDEFQFRASAGTTVREIYATGPWLWWDAFTISFRWLDPAMLQNMGEKFFTEFRKRDAPCNDCDVKGSDGFKLSAWDFYAHLSGGDSSGNKWGMTALLARDEYAIGQDTTSELGKSNNVQLLQGEQAYTVVTAEYAGASGLGWHAGYVAEEWSNALRDTVGFRSDADISGDENYRNFIDSTHQSHDRYSVGADDMLSRRILGADISWSMEYERHQVERNWYANTKGVKLQDNLVQGVGRLTWKPKDHQVILGVGAVSTVTEDHAPIASLDWEHRLGLLEGLRIFAGSAWRSQYAVEAIPNGIEGTLQDGASAKLGVGIERNSLRASIHGFGRYFPDPSLPEPQAFWYLQETRSANYAWVSGASATAEWRTVHHLSLQTNASSVYGEYEMKDQQSMAWPSNVRFEISSHLRIYPRSDSLLSIILSHRAAWHRPTYAYSVRLGEDGTRQVKDAGVFTDLYRTDVRLNLDLQSAWKPLENVRFYVEADNVFAPLETESLAWLGADNARERSQVTRDSDKNADNGFEVVPFLAKGMGLYVQFGVEGNLGF